VLHDRAGDSIVLEFDHGRFTVYDNPVGVMTNGPQFSWHLTNLANYTFLSNIDQSVTTFGKLKVHQPDAGIATAGLPASNTSVGRFVKAVYYSQFAEKVSDPDQAVRTLAHIMNNFDRPKGITVSTGGGGEGGLDIKGVSAPNLRVTTEYTSWTNLTDLNRGHFYLRTYDGLNYTMFAITALAQIKEVTVLPLSELNGMAADGTAKLIASHKAP
jgi:penicillin V acylase-like amidase (Ntn superfamily)